MGPKMDPMAPCATQLEWLNDMRPLYTTSWRSARDKRRHPSKDF